MTNFPKNKQQHQQHKSHHSKTQGVGRLSIDAILAITDIVESVHKRILSGSAVGTPPDPKPLSGIGGLVYRNIRNITAMVGRRMDRPLAILSQNLAANPHSRENQALLSALNGVLGDHLVNTHNALAIPMHFRLDGNVLSDLQLLELINHNQGKLLIMVHGLCMNDLQWSQEGHDHGALLAKEFGMSALYLHYNTGQHISDNGKYFAELLDHLSKLTSSPISINIVAHSMGGLVSRSALHIAENNGHAWPERLNKLVFLGTPHHGAALEKAGNWVDLILGAHSYTTPFAKLVKIRSAGITDLRYGNVRESDWNTDDRFAFAGDKRLPLPLPDYVQCFAVATSAGKSEKYILGDGLVSIKSALGEHQDPEFQLNIPTSRQWIGNNVNHMQLLNDAKVYAILKTWFEAK